MSENISLPAARVPMVDDKGMITREWLTLLSGMFRRVGGPVGFSNSELYGDAVALQSYDELLERISSLEAQNRSLGQVVQMLAAEQMQDYASKASAVEGALDTLTVRGDTRLASQKGRVIVGGASYSGNALMHSQGDANIYVDESALIPGGLRVNDVKVVSFRQPGIPAYTAYAGQTVSAAYTQAQAQATDNAIKDASAKLAQVVTALRTHGLIGD